VAREDATEGLAPLAREAYVDLVRRALAEDVGPGDVTTEATVSPSQWARGVFLIKERCVVAGLDVALEAFRQIDPSTTAQVHTRDGQACEVGQVLAIVDGPARALLIAERTALNFLQRLSGIATRTRQFVEAAGGGVRVLDTRKTTPTLRALEKYAVLVGGGTNHRFGLYDAVLIKDNHVRLAGGVRAAVAKVRAHRPELHIEVEAQSLEEVDAAIAAGADIVLADNMSLDEVRETVRRTRGHTRVEISGGVTLDRLPELARTGAEYVSVGGLTHSAPAVDISFEIEALASEARPESLEPCLLTLDEESPRSDGQPKDP
jgi:nicotinate-nucleotide pyrophosphorylase (carboxylating)